MESVSERFLRYVKIDTQSDESSESCPSTEKQLNLARLLEKELKNLGLSDVILDKNGYVSASLPANTTKDLPVVGFVAHMDTSPDMSGTDVKAQIVENYDGTDITLDRETILSPEDFPELLNYIGHDLITTDGSTLLGADNKAGIAEIICAIEYFMNKPDIKHGTIKLCFTPDEEIGRGADRFDIKSFGADFAFTIDGGQPGELEFENFNAALATITFKGRNVHPGTAKNQMLNSMHLARQFMDMLPANQRPEHTEGYEGFFHLVDIDGTVEETVIRYIIRDHNRELFEKKKGLVKNIAEYIDNLDSRGSVAVALKDQYYNMREKIEPHMHIIDLAEEAIREAGVDPIIKPIRGGTDGARLSFMGLPCPNVFTGGHNFHGKYEYISIQSMEKAVETIKNIISAIVIKY